MHFQENSAIGTYIGFSTAWYPLQSHTMDFGVPSLSRKLPCKALMSVAGAVLFSSSWVTVLIAWLHRKRSCVGPRDTDSNKRMCKKNTYSLYS